MSDMSKYMSGYTDATCTGSRYTISGSQNRQDVIVVPDTSTSEGSHVFGGRGAAWHGVLVANDMICVYRHVCRHVYRHVCIDMCEDMCV